VLALDDLLVDLVNDLSDVIRPIIGEVIFGHHDAPLPDVAKPTAGQAGG
jgi:hypothetical protein